MEVIFLKKFEGILFCTDLDGTLFTKDKTVSKENLDAIEYFKSQGGRFTFITGRIPATSKEVYDIIKPNAPYGCFNGSGIYDGENQKFLWTAKLSDKITELVECVYKQMPHIGIEMNTETTPYLINDNAVMVRRRSIKGLEKNSCHYNDISEPVYKVVFAHDDAEELERLSELLAQHPNSVEFDFLRSERTLYEVLPKGVNKGFALYKMADLLGIDRRKTVAVGDYNNDVAMIKHARWGFAVANAVDEVKAAADYITVSNNDHAIAAIIEGLDNYIG